MEETHERTHGFGEIGIQRREVSAVRGFSWDFVIGCQIEYEIICKGYLVQIALDRNIAMYFEQNKI